MHTVQRSVTHMNSLYPFSSSRRTSFLEGMWEEGLQSSAPYSGIWLRSLKSDFCRFYHIPHNLFSVAELCSFIPHKACSLRILKNQFRRIKNRSSRILNIGSFVFFLNCARGEGSNDISVYSSQLGSLFLYSWHQLLPTRQGTTSSGNLELLHCVLI